jgi:hypothetical protein
MFCDAQLVYRPTPRHTKMTVIPTAASKRRQPDGARNNQLVCWYCVDLTILNPIDYLYCYNDAPQIHNVHYFYRYNFYFRLHKCQASSGTIKKPERHTSSAGTVVERTSIV